MRFFRTKWWIPDAIKNTLHANYEMTFYVRYGDFLGRLSGFLAIFIVLYTIVQHLLNRSLIKNKY